MNKYLMFSIFTIIPNKTTLHHEIIIKLLLTKYVSLKCNFKKKRSQN